MFAVFQSLSLRYLRLRWERALLIVASIALGVGTLVSTRIMNQVLEAAAHDTMMPFQQSALMVSNGELRVLRSLTDEIRAAKLPQLEAVVPLIIEQARLKHLDDSEQRTVTLIGGEAEDLLNLKTDGKSAFDVRILDLRVAKSGKGIFLSQALYQERQNANIRGKTVRLRFATTEREYPIAGYLIVDPSSSAATLARNLVAMSLNQAIELVKPQFALPGLLVSGALPAGADAARGEEVSRIDIFLKPGASVEEAKQSLEQVVGQRARVQTPQQARKSTDDAISGIKIGFSLCSVGAMVVGIFLVYNALSVSVAERRHDIGVMRSVGATRSQIAGLFAAEAALLGVAGAILGLPLGIALADGAIYLVKEDLNAMFLNSDIRPTRLSLWTMGFAVLAGVVTALMAALVPAIQAARDEPADAVRRVPASSHGLFHRIHQFASLLMILIGVGMIYYRSELPQRLGGYLGMVFTLVGLFLALPLMIRALAGMLQPLARRFFGVEFRLAADNLLRSPGRTGVVIGALAAGVSLMFQTAGVGRSNEEPVQSWIDQVIQADAFVFWGSLTSASSSFTWIDPGVGEELKTILGVEQVCGLRFVRPDYNGTIICMLAMDGQAYHQGTTSRLAHPLPGLDKFAELHKGNFVVVSENFAIKFGVKEGDTITLPSRRRGPIDLMVIGVGQDYTWTKGTIFIDRARYRELFDDPWVDSYYVFFDRSKDYAATFQAVKNFTETRKLEVVDRAFFREYLAGIIDKIYKLAYMQQVIVAIVAALGVVTALLISVLQRRRELGLLRAVGASQTQVLRTVIAEATLMGILGTLLGIALGLPMEWYILRIVLFEESGFYFPMIIPWKQAIGISLVAIAVATIAGLIPALHAMRLRITEAIAYE